MHRYRCYNGAMATTAATATVLTGTAIKTMLQLSTPSTRQIQIISWGFNLNGPPNGVVELIETDVAATSGAAHVAAGVQPLVPGAPASLLTLGTGNTGYTFTVEGSITATRLFDQQILTATADSQFRYGYQFTKDERPIVAVSKFLRVRATMGSTVSMACWIVWDE